MSKTATFPFETAARTLAYILAGNGKFTIRSKASSVTFKYTVEASSRDPNTLFVNYKRDYIGFIRGRRLIAGKKGRPSTASYKALEYALKLLDKYTQLPIDAYKQTSLEVWHEGVCGRCGRTLTNPDSIASGIGPVCAAADFN